MLRRSGGPSPEKSNVMQSNLLFVNCKQLPEIMASLRGDVPDADIVDTTPEVPPVGRTSYWCRYAHEILV